MKVSCTFTLNELQRITPSLRKEHFFSECPKVKEALYKLFWNLGCTIEDKFDLVEGVTTLNRFGEEDDSVRINVYERDDPIWKSTKYASHQVKIATDDVTLMKQIDGIANQRSYEASSEVK